MIRSFQDYHVPYTGLDAAAANSFGPYMNFVLGYIAFTVGAALHFASTAPATSTLSTFTSRLVPPGYCRAATTWLPDWV